ncbi:protein phosphatase CheZ [Thiorhodospira sibirica]|uniref:protein phosphatase CheZ n=1 Tax=Thiorhodospira sibirica TaxID=154347 RepID=UPI00022C4C43|nr:protein phosphatase CheZ [Thiorhodospira sibirica]
MNEESSTSLESEIQRRQLEQARELVKLMESGDDLQAGKLIEELGRMHESLLFQQIGKLTRDLHEALNGFRMDSRLSEITEEEIPDAKERLNYVVVMTEQAANRTLTAVETVLPLIESLTQQASELGSDWQRFRQRELSADDFRELSRKLDLFFEQMNQNSELMRRNLSDVLMAQDFQDLTGQVIRRVINLVQDVEENLVGLVRISGQRLSNPDAKFKQEQKDTATLTTGTGPTVPGTSDAKQEVMTAQDDVDDLLSSLGF